MLYPPILKPSEYPHNSRRPRYERVAQLWCFTIFVIYCMVYRKFDIWIMRVERIQVRRMFVRVRNIPNNRGHNLFMLFEIEKVVPILFQILGERVKQDGGGIIFLERVQCLFGA